MLRSICLVCVLLFLTCCQSAPPREDEQPAAPPAEAGEAEPGVSVDGAAFGGELGDLSSLEAKAAPAAQGAQQVYRRELGGGAEGAQVVVLIHGGPGLSHDYMVRMAEHIAAPSVRVALYDQRGAGRSPAVPPSEQTLAGQVADLEALRSALGAERIVLVGHSWGGLVAMAYASEHAARVSKLVLVDTMAPSAPGVVASQRAFSVRLRELMARGVIPAAVDASVTEPCARDLLEIMPAYFHDVNHPDTKHLGGSSCSDAVLQATWINLGDFDLGEPLKRVSAPTWIIAGESDPFGLGPTQEAAAKLAHKGPAVTTLPACGHIPWEECPQPFYEVLNAALKAP